MHHSRHDFTITSIQSIFQWNNELWNDWEDLFSTILQHVPAANFSEHGVRMFLFAESWNRSHTEDVNNKLVGNTVKSLPTVEKHRQVVVKVKLVHFNFPLDAARVVVVNLHRKIAAFVELPERCVRWIGSTHHGLPLRSSWALILLWGFCSFRRREQLVSITTLQKILWGHLHFSITCILCRFRQNPARGSGALW